MTRHVLHDRRRRWVLRAPLVVLLLAAAACGGGGSSPKAAGSGGGLVGLFKIDSGTCTTGAVTSGSYFRMIQTGGKPTAGPFVSNGDSTCGDKSWSRLLPGKAGGFRTGAFQPDPKPAFDKAGNGLAADIVEPVKWFAVKFAISTNSVDPQSKGTSSEPSVVNAGGKLTGDLRAFGAAWNGVYFNQGSPKPDASKPGNTSGPTGTYDAATHHFTLDWLSQIVGGPFNNFTGVWHLEGTFVPAGS